MKSLAVTLLALAVAGTVAAQESPSPTRMGAGTTINTESANLPIEPIGSNDLIGITVYDSPELTRNVRVDGDGNLRLPMLQKPVRAAGLYPADLENAIRAALIDGQVLVDPVVTVSIVEYRSRPINVSGAVRNPMTFQATGTVTLLDAISQAGGLTDNAGAEILVSRPQTDADGKAVPLVQRIPVHELMNGSDPTLNLKLQGGEEIRVPDAGRIYVVGTVKKPGVFSITDGSESSVLKALALSEGLDHYSGHVAYIYRTEGANGGKNEIPIELKKIMNRQSPDVALMANDILYVPEASGRRVTATTLDRLAIVGLAVSTALIYVYR